MSGAVFLKLEGIDGEATDDEHTDEIDIMSWGWGMTQDSAVHAGGGTTVGRVNVMDLNITKYMDKSSPTLIKHCCSGKAIPTGVLTVQKAGEDKVKALELELTDIVITSFAPGGSSNAGELPMESITIAFKEFMYKYTPQDEASAGAATIDQGWNIGTNKAA